jgi:hypothetical protein
VFALRKLFKNITDIEFVEFRVQPGLGLIDMDIGFIKSLRFYLVLAKFRMHEPFSDLKATGITYVLYCFFIWVLSQVWFRFKLAGSDFSYEKVFLYIGVTEMLFMSFLSSRAIISGSEDFALYLVRPRSWLGREIIGNIAANFGKRIIFCLCLLIFALFAQVAIEGRMQFVLRLIFLILVLALPQALLSSLFSALRLSYPQTEYFVLPFSKLFLSLGGVFGPLSDYGEPWRTWLLNLPGSDLFFQPAYFAVNGYFYKMDLINWLIRILVIDLILYLSLLFFYLKGRKAYQAWGG